jgi:hypothetical protein
VRHLTVLSLAATLPLSLFALPAAAAGPIKGARYQGRTSQDRILTARVTSDGRGLQLTFDEDYSCNRGPGKTTHAVYLDERPTIRPNGTFDYQKTYTNLAPVHGFEQRHTERQHISGSFTAGGTRVHGRLADSVVGVDGLSCRSAATFTARRSS